MGNYRKVTPRSTETNKAKKVDHEKQTKKPIGKKKKKN